MWVACEVQGGKTRASSRASPCRPRASTSTGFTVLELWGLRGCARSRASATGRARAQERERQEETRAPEPPHASRARAPAWGDARALQGLFCRPCFSPGAG
eukprot:13662184-Alexandrium_andersonii.AAC.1